jgi:hypothetical protein
VRGRKSEGGRSRKTEGGRRRGDLRVFRGRMEGSVCINGNYCKQGRNGVHVLHVHFLCTFLEKTF